MTLRRNCEGITRRDSIQYGLGALLGTGLVDGLRVRGEAAKQGEGPQATAERCILIWMDGGPTHFETFDPKPDAPVEFRGEFTHTKTAVPGALFSEHMVKAGRKSGRLRHDSVYSSQPGQPWGRQSLHDDRSSAAHSGGCGAFVSFHPSLGSVVAKELGEDNGLPSYFSMPQMSRSGGPNFLGAKYAPFVVADNPNSSNFKVRDVALPKELGEARFNVRTDLRTKIDRMVRLNDEAAADPVAAFDEYFEQGYNMVTSAEAQSAFDIEKESDEMRDRYGRNTFGQRCLLARRLVEGGVPFVTVYDGGWDHHSDLFGACRKRLPDWDNSVATLIQDLKERGLLDTTLVVALGEFGRTPKVSTLTGQKKPGRDHWANAMSVLMAGGGTPGGRCCGSNGPQRIFRCRQSAVAGELRFNDLSQAGH